MTCASDRSLGELRFDSSRDDARADLDRIDVTDGPSADACAAIRLAERVCEVHACGLVARRVDVRDVVTNDIHPLLELLHATDT